MTDCDKRNINCPPRYKNIGSENFGDDKKVTAELLYQFCKNDSYLYDQIKKLWDKTDPEHRKRFYPPYYMDTSKSYGVEPLVFSEDSSISEDLIGRKISVTDVNKIKSLNGQIQNAYHLSNATHEEYVVDFDPSNDTTNTVLNSNGIEDTLVIHNDDLIEESSTLKIVTEDIGTPSTPIILHTVVPEPTSTDISNEIPFKTIEYEEVPVTTNPKVQNKNKVIKTKEDVYGKLTLDATCDGPYHNWHANSVWYIGYNRHKNYNIKNKWRKNPDDTTIPSICRGQTFKAKHTGELRKIVLLMRGSSKSVSPCIVEIRTVGKNGKPTSKVLAKTSQKFNHSDKALVNFTFKKPCKVNKGTQYAIVVRSPLSNFNHCYWLGGWASTCFSNSRKRAYYDGETFLSEDNGKTWIVHGKKEKSYGSHYYDWGFAEAPVNFGFEVYIAPKTGTQTVTKKVPVKTTMETKKTINGTTTIKKPIIKEDYYTASIHMTYYQAGDYYLEFKPFVGNFYTKIQCIYDISDERPNPSENIGDYSWEIFNNDTKEWESFSDYALSNSTNLSEDNVNQTSTYELEFSKALTYVKVRLKLTLRHNVLIDDDDESGSNKVVTQLENLMELNSERTGEDYDAEAIAKFVQEVMGQFVWVTPTDPEAREIPMGLRKLKSVVFHLYKKPSFKGYVRTLEYHPVQEGMLPACIWSEVDIDAIPKMNGQCKVDIVHEQTSIDRVLLYHADNIDLRNYIVEFDPTQTIDTFTSRTDIKDYIIKQRDSATEDGSLYTYNEEFVEWLSEQSPKIYLLPYTIQETQEVEGEDTLVDVETVYFLFNEDNAKVEIEHYPSYPINSCGVSTDTVTYNLSEIIDNSNLSNNDNIIEKFVKLDDKHFTYTHPTSLEGDVNSIKMSFHYSTKEDEETVEDGENVEVETTTLTLTEGEDKDFTINDNVITFTLYGDGTTTSDSDFLLNQFIKMDNDPQAVKVFDLVDMTTIDGVDYYQSFNVDETEFIIDMNSYDYNEFQDYLVDYDNKTLMFYNPFLLSEGELKVNYNPLWARDLDIEDFPLKMDLWTEYYLARQEGVDDTDNPYFSFEKCPIGECGKPIFDFEMKEFGDDEYITTTVPPLDNIRALEIQDYEGNTLEELIEDDDYYVDYLTNQIYITTPLLNDGDAIMVKYTPNLTDNGLSLAYRLSRPLYDNNEDVSAEDYVTKTSTVRTDVDTGDDVFCLSNYFTTRT